MADRHHYVAQFHLRAFADPTSAGSASPWLWVGDCKSGTVKRRSPKNFAWVRGLYEGPGGLSDRDSTLESFLSTEVEGPAAIALRGIPENATGATSAISSDLWRYIAWAAARSLPMKALFQSWIDCFPPERNARLVELPPPGLAEARSIGRNHRMAHATHGVRDDVPSEQVEALLGQGWRLQIGTDDFLELVHLQAWYFQVRHFPRLRWILLAAPADSHFIIGDRPVVWGFSGRSDVAPSALRNALVQLAAPLSSSRALFAHHATSRQPEVIMPNDINRIVASAAHDWIAGPTEAVVRKSLLERSYS